MSRARALRIIAVVLAFALVGTACAGGLFGGDDGTYEIQAQFRRSFNLFPGSEVRVIGVEVGHVKEVEVPEGAATVTVTMVLKDDVRLPDDVRALIVPQALLGERYVQLDPPYTSGERLAEGATIPFERTGVPAEFDEVLESLNAYLGALDEDEVARLVTNLAGTLDGQGRTLGETLESAELAVDALRENDDALIALATRLSDLNQVLASRDDEIGALIENWNTLAGSLADDRGDIDAALGGLADMTTELAGLLETNRVTLEDDVATLTRVGRTAERNLDEFERLIHAQSELYRHAHRVVDRERNWLPLIEHASQLLAAISDRLNNRLAGLCLRLEVPACSDVEFWEGELPEELCLPPLIPCPEGDEPGAQTAIPVADALEDALEAVPELEEALEQLPPADDPPPEGPDPTPTPDLPLDDSDGDGIPDELDPDDEDGLVGSTTGDLGSTGGLGGGGS